MTPFTGALHRLNGFIILGCLLFTGCRTVQEYISDKITPPHTPTNIYSTSPLTSSIRRVIFLPLAYESAEGDFLLQLDKIFAAELNKTKLFEVVPVSREELDNLFAQRQFSSVGTFPSNFLNLLKSEYALDAIMFTDLIYYHPYKPIAVGVRSKLMDLSTGKIVWAFDNLFDAGDPSISLAARRYNQHYNHTAFPLNDSKGLLQSPMRFSKYVAFEVYRSLPQEY